MVSSSLPLARVCPSGLNETLLTQSVCPVSVRITRPVPTSHKRMVSSSLPLARVCPSGLNETLKTKDVCPVSRESSSPVCVSYSQIPGALPTARRVPSGEYAISLIQPFPRRAFAPSGRFNVCPPGAVCARLACTNRATTNKRTMLNNRVFFI